MLFILVSLCIFILFIFMFYLINRDTSIVDGEIIRIDKESSPRPNIPPYIKYKTIITYFYFVNDKKYISTITDDLGLSNIFYKYKKTNLNNKYTYYVEKKNIRVCYKNNNPQDSKIKNFILKEFLYLLIFSIIFGLIGSLIVSLIWYIFLKFY